MQNESVDCAAYLKQVYSESLKNNSSYSLRAFARKLKLSPGGLSQILSRKKKLSLSRAHEIAQILNLDHQESQYFLLLAQMDGARTTAHKSEIYEKLKAQTPSHSSVHDLSLEQFRLISDWYGFAIIEYITNISGSSTSDEIAKFFKISKIEVENTIERLQRLEIIEKTTKGYKRISDRILVEGVNSSDALKKYYTSVQSQVQRSIEEQTPKEKVIGAEVFAFDPAGLDQAKALTHQYLDDLASLAKQGKNRTEIYEVFVDFFRLNQRRKK